MRTAVMRVMIDAVGELGPEAYESGLTKLRGLGLEVVATPVRYLPDRNREIELILDERQLEGRDDYVTTCSQVFGAPAAAGVVTYISRGTDDDAHGVLAAFGVHADVERSELDDGEMLIVTLAAEDMLRVHQGRLHTALEAALNCEVRIVERPGSSGEGAPEQGGA